MEEPRIVEILNESLKSKLDSPEIDLKEIAETLAKEAEALSKDK